MVLPTTDEGLGAATVVTETIVSDVLLTSDGRLFTAGDVVAAFDVTDPGAPRPLWSVPVSARALAWRPPILAAAGQTGLHVLEVGDEGGPLVHTAPDIPGDHVAFAADLLAVREEAGWECVRVLDATQLSEGFVSAAEPLSVPVTGLLGRDDGLVIATNKQWRHRGPMNATETAPPRAAGVRSLDTTDLHAQRFAENTREKSSERSGARSSPPSVPLERPCVAREQALVVNP